MIKKIWCISDTHGKHGQLDIPENIDLVIHSGDVGTVREPSMNANVVLDFIEWYKSLPIKHKVFIGGNHDTSIEHRLVGKSEIGEDITYLEHESIEIEGLKIFGSPFTPTFGHGWSFNKARHKLDRYWSEIPRDTDILITHGPPKGILDTTENGILSGAVGNGNKLVCSCGDKSLLKHVREIQPLVHVFGHIHNEDSCLNAAIMQIQGCRTKFINASVLDLDYKINNNGFIIDI